MISVVHNSSRHLGTGGRRQVDESVPSGVRLVGAADRTTVPALPPRPRPRGVVPGEFGLRWGTGGRKRCGLGGEAKRHPARPSAWSIRPRCGSSWAAQRYPRSPGAGSACVHRAMDPHRGARDRLGGSVRRGAGAARSQLHVRAARLREGPQRLGLELWRRLQPGLDFRPVLIERIPASASRAAASAPMAACWRRRTGLPRVALSRRVRVWPFKPLP